MTSAELGPTLEAARSGPEVLAALAAGCWARTHKGADCPPEAAPSMAALAAWLPSCPPADAKAAAERLPAVLPFDVRRARWRAHSAPSFPDPPVILARWEDAEGGGWLPVAHVHRRWAALPAAERPPHPLAPIVSAWMVRPRRTAPDARPNGILPRTMGEGGPTLVPVRPGADADADADWLPELPGPALGAPADAGWLFKPPSPASDALPAPLVLADASGAPPLSRGRGAPLPLRLFVEAVLAVPPQVRWRASLLEIPARELIAQLWPGSPPRWAGRNGFQRPLMTALRSIGRYGFEVVNGPKDIQWWRPALVRAYPKTLDAKAVLDVRLPEGSEVGALLNRSVLRWQGLRSGPSYRCYMALAGLRNRHGTAKGRILPSHVPEVLEDRGGLLSARRQPILDAKTGRRIRSRWHPKAVRTGRTILNPALLGALPWLEGRDICALCWPDGAGPRNPKRRMQAARKVLAGLEADGVLLVLREYPEAGSERYRGRWKLILTDRPEPAQSDALALPGSSVVSGT